MEISQEQSFEGKHLNLLAKNKKILPMRYIRTPPQIWESLSKEFSFSIDACASDCNHLLPRYWTKQTNALAQNWDNEIVYCHPMYDSNIPKFIAKSFDHNCLTVFLLPASTNAVYFHKFLWDFESNQSKKNVTIKFLPKPDNDGYKFGAENGDMPKTGYLRPLMVVIVDNRKSN
tara:strand:- start:28 stop:549 length:522 start_codon:yes stop_codon:yes gene_type:complete